MSSILPVNVLLLQNSCFFFFNDTATTEIYTLSLHDALPIFSARAAACSCAGQRRRSAPQASANCSKRSGRSEEHTSELQSPDHLVCRLLLEKKNDIHDACLVNLYDDANYQ